MPDEQAEASDGERVLRAVISHVRSMPSRSFDSSDTDFPPALRFICAAFTGRSVQAATVARLACMSRATRKLAANLLPAHARRAWHASFCALQQLIALARDAGQIELLDALLQSEFGAQGLAPMEALPAAFDVHPDVAALSVQSLHQAAFRANVLANSLGEPAAGLRRYFIRRTWREDGYNSDGGVMVARRLSPDDGYGGRIRRCHSR